MQVLLRAANPDMDGDLRGLQGPASGEIARPSIQKKHAVPSPNRSKVEGGKRMRKLPEIETEIDNVTAVIEEMRRSSAARRVRVQEATAERGRLAFELNRLKNQRAKGELSALRRELDILAEQEDDALAELEF